MKNARLATILLAAATLSITPAQAQTPVEGNVTNGKQCFEDEPCFEWSTMGDLTRGVILKTAPKDCRWRDGWSKRCFVVLDASEYCHARKANVIDLKRTRPLKGDRIARDHGCDSSMFAQNV